MNYLEAIDYIESLALIKENRPGTERIEKFLSCYGNPQDKFKSMHVGGTNGKGSTVAILDSILRAAKFKTARFTGPHILRLNERFHIDGQPITDNELAARVSKLKEQSENFAQRYPHIGSLSWFEFLTAIAFFYFADNSIDIAVVEVGLGGRYDATNVIQKLYATGITNIAFDHERILGSTLSQIAAEKAGIIKPNIPIVTGAKEEALKVISEKASQLNSQLIVCDKENFLPANIAENNKNRIMQRISQYGQYQRNNISVALNMMSAANLDSSTTAENKPRITQDEILIGLDNFYWPGRFQTVASEHLIMDCGHNPACTESLRDSLNQLYPDKPYHFIFACYADKDGISMLKHLLRSGDRLYLVQPIGKRPFFSNTILAEFAQTSGLKTKIYDNLQNALSEAKQNRKEDEYIIATGSFSVVKAVMQILGWTSVEDGLN